MPSLVSGLAAPFPSANVDTDVIMPKRFLRTITREGLADGVLADLRFDDAGDKNPGFVLHQPQYADADILVVGDNFGCGSSREHAVWGLKQLGIKAIIGTSFAGIFYDNARKNTLVLASIKPAEREALLEAIGQQSQNVTVDLDALEVRWADGVAAIEMDDATRQSLIHERDDVTDTLALSEEIKSFEKARPKGLRFGVSK